MRIPLLHTTASALYVSEARVAWACGTRLRHRLVALETDSEPVADGDVEATLRRLLERVRLPHPQVVVHLDPLHVRHVVLQGPPFDEPATFEAWLDAEVRRLLPPQADAADFVVRYQFLEETEEHTRCLLAVCSRAAVVQCSELLASNGLEPLTIRSADVAVGEAMAWTPAFYESESALLVVRPGDAALIQMQGGLLHALTVLDQGAAATDPVSLLQDVALLLAPGTQQLYIVGEASETLIQAAHSVPGLNVTIQHGELVVDHTGRMAPVAPHAVPAAALVMQHLFPLPGALELLEPDTALLQQQAVEKREATRLTLTAGAAVGAVVLLLMLTAHYLQGKHDAAAAVLHERAEQVAQLERAQAAVARLERDIAQAERLVVERTNVAGVLEGIGRAAPENLWLNAATLATASPEAPARLTLTGAALSKSEVADYLNRLEQLPTAAGVRLLFSETLPATRIHAGHEHFPDAFLTRFEIVINLK